LLYDFKPISRTLLAIPALSLICVPAFADERTDSTILVTGQHDNDGLMPDQDAPKGVSAISADFIAKQAPTFNAYQLVKLLPGANVATTDPFGLSAMSSLTMRGLGQDAIAVLMEGAPQNDVGYYVAYPSQFADAENIRQITLTQGAVDLDTPAVAAAGGVLSLSLDDPKNKAGALLNLSAGSYHNRRAFVRLDTGELGNSGIKGFVSYSYNRANNWRGAGFDTRHHVDAKLLRKWGDGNRASVSMSFNEANTSTYPSPTLADWQAVGRDFNLDERYTAGNTNYWRLYRAPFRSLYFTAPFHLKLSDAVTLDASNYMQFGYGNSPYGTQLSETGNFLGTEEITQRIPLPGAENGVATVLGNWTGDQFRAGNVSKLTWETGQHTLIAGLWFDYGKDRVLQTYTEVRPDGRPVSGWGRPHEAILTPDGRLLAYENQRTRIYSKGFFLADSIEFTPKLTVDIGFKGVHILRKGVNYLPGPQSDVRFSSFAALPRAAVKYEIDEQQQIFANFSTSFRAPNEFALYNSYWGGEIATQGAQDLKNEYAISKEAGYRYTSPSLSLAMTAYHYQFRNRQVPTIINSGGALVNSTINAGRQTSYGVDAEANYRPSPELSLYVSGAYLHTRLNDDMPVGDDFLPTRGKRAVSSPSWQFGLGSNYDDGRLFGTAALKYVSRQYASFINDESINGYATLDLSIGIHLQGLIDDQKTDLRLNAINITNPRVLSGVQMISMNAQDVTGRNGSLISGFAPTYYIASGRAFVATLSRAF
jgi:iron complex outermembrane receptor protein